MRFRTVALLLAIMTIGGCITDEQRKLVGSWERFEVPSGLFPEQVDKKSYASGKVSYYFVSAKDKMVADPALMFAVMAYFEWLFNDLRTDNRLTEQQLVKLAEARNQIRDMIAMPHGLTSAEATDQYYSLSKYMALAKSEGDGTKSPEGAQQDELDRRRMLLVSAQDLIRRAIVETEKLRLPASPGAVAGKGANP